MIIRFTVEGANPAQIKRRATAIAESFFEMRSSDHLVLRYAEVTPRLRTDDTVTLWECEVEAEVRPEMP